MKIPRKTLYVFTDYFGKTYRIFADSAERAEKTLSKIGKSAKVIVDGKVINRLKNK